MALLHDLGPYHIIRRIGKGGMGDVYLADDTRKPEGDASRRVALKVMWLDIDSDSPGVLHAEKQGAQLQARLYGIDNRVARVNGYGELEDTFYIDMEFIEGRDLAELIQKGPVEPVEALRIALEVADILSRCHTMRFEHDSHDARGVVHGDIKPRNIRLETSGKVRLLDFGIAKALSLTRKLTRNEFGSVSYASPERLNTGDVNELCDLWSLAVVLYEMLSGKPPFDDVNTRKIEQRIVQASPAISLPASTPAPLKRLLDKALAKQLDQRFPTATHFKLGLKEVMREISGTRVSLPSMAPSWVGKPEQIPSLEVAPIQPTQFPPTPSPTATPPDAETRRTQPEGVTPVSRGAAKETGPQALTGATTGRQENHYSMASTQAVPTVSRPIIPLVVPLESSEISATVRVAPVARPPKGASVVTTEDENAAEHTRRTVRPDASASPSIQVEPEEGVTRRNIPELDARALAEPLPLGSERKPEGQFAGQADAKSEIPPPTLLDDRAVVPATPTAVQAPTDVTRVFPPRWLSVAAVLTVMGLAGAAFVNDKRVERGLRDLAEQVNSQNLSCGAAWGQYQGLQEQSWFRPDFPGLRDPLLRLCSQEVDLVIKRYRDDQPGLNKSDWERANEAAQHLNALHYTPQFMAWQNYTLGQILRIDDKHDAALAVFDKAAELDLFCDPYLAKMQLYAYSTRKNLDDFVAAQAQATERGCPPQRKHEIWQADLRFDKAEALYKGFDAKALPEDQKVALTEIKGLYEDAQKVYKQNRTVGNAKKKNDTCNKRLADIKKKLELLEPPPPEPEVNPFQQWFPGVRFQHN